MADAVDSNDGDERSAGPWYEGKLVLLVAGFILTGLLGPWLQFVQKKLEWKREVSMRAFDRQLTAMQNARRDLTSAYVAETRLIEDRDRAGQIDARPETSATIDRDEAVRTDRLKTTASLFVSAESFCDIESLKGKLRELAVEWRVLADCAREIKHASKPAELKLLNDRFDESKRMFDEDYQLLRQEFQRQIGRFEDANMDGFSGYRVANQTCVKAAGAETVK